MALKQFQQLKLSQKLLPQQILLMKLLQLPTLALEERIKEELEANPALEEETDADIIDEELFSNENSDENEAEEEFDDAGEIKEGEIKTSASDVEVEDYMGAEELDSYKYEISNKGQDDDFKETVVVEGIGFQELLEQQLGLKDITDRE